MHWFCIPPGIPQYCYLYFYAYLVYYISMKVSRSDSPIEILRKTLRDQNGILYSADLDQLGVARVYLKKLMEQGEVYRVSRGVYSKPESWEDEMMSLQVRYKSAILSHETALYLLGLIDRTPIKYTVTVPSGYNASLLKQNQIKVFFIQSSLHSLGMISHLSPAGNHIQTYNMERTICDIIRNRNRIDIQLVNGALKAYIKKIDKNLPLLNEYAERLSIQKKIREYIEVLL